MTTCFKSKDTTGQRKKDKAIVNKTPATSDSCAGQIKYLNYHLGLDVYEYLICRAFASSQHVSILYISQLLMSSRLLLAVVGDTLQTI
jgi:hypothetical protein